jgi:hypothetical protein
LNRKSANQFTEAARNALKLDPFPFFSSLEQHVAPQNRKISSNRIKPKIYMFRLIFGLFRKTKKIVFGLLTRFERTETTETKRSVSKQTEKKRKKQQKN